MTLMEQIITIAIGIVCVQFTRLLPFWIFPANRPIPDYIRYLGKVLPAAMFGMLVVYCYKNIDIFDNAAIISFSKYRQLSQFSGNTGPGTQ